MHLKYKAASVKPNAMYRLSFYFYSFMEVNSMVANIIVGGAFAAVLVAKWTFFSRAYAAKQGK